MSEQEQLDLMKELEQEDEFQEFFKIINCDNEKILPSLEAQKAAELKKTEGDSEKDIGSKSSQIAPLV